MLYNNLSSYLKERYGKKIKKSSFRNFFSVISDGGVGKMCNVIKAKRWL